MITDTILFDKIIFGPLKSRRLGLSLGINLLPVDSKICNFNCIYCECGWTDLKNAPKQRFHTRRAVRESLEQAFTKLKEQNIKPDTITFAGNGEPTMHPEFREIVEETILLKNSHFPTAKVAVLSNASMLNNKKVVDSLRHVDLPILKLDAGTEELFQMINQPYARRSLAWIVDHLHYFREKLIIQTLFLKGLHEGVYLDNTTDEAVESWLGIIRDVRPETVMIYSIDRATPAHKLEKIPIQKLHEIALRVGLLGIRSMVR